MNHRVKSRRVELNDARILEAARAVFVGNPEAPIGEVAKKAGVGISALYRRYQSKEALLAALCRDGLERYVSEARAAVADEAGGWSAFADFMSRLAEANTHALVLRLAGTFTPDTSLYELAATAQALNERIFERAQASGVLRREADVNDINVIGELVASLSLGTGDRSRVLRQRYLTMLLNGLRREAGDPLPGPPPSWAEIEARWRS